MMRKMILDSIRTDPGWANGEYEQQPRGLRAALYTLLVMGSSPLQMQKSYPTREAADKFLDEWLAARLASTDANDLLYQSTRRATTTPPQARCGQGDRAGDQLGRRLHQPPRVWHRGARDQAREERPLRPAADQRPDARATAPTRCRRSGSSTWPSCSRRPPAERPPHTRLGSRAPPMTRGIEALQTRTVVVVGPTEVGQEPREIRVRLPERHSGVVVRGRRLELDRLRGGFGRRKRARVLADRLRCAPSPGRARPHPRRSPRTGWDPRRPGGAGRLPVWRGRTRRVRAGRTPWPPRDRPGAPLRRDRRGRRDGFRTARARRAPSACSSPCLPPDGQAAIHRPTWAAQRPAGSVVSRNGTRVSGRLAPAANRDLGGRPRRSSTALVGSVSAGVWLDVAGVVPFGLTQPAAQRGMATGRSRHAPPGATRMCGIAGMFAFDPRAGQVDRARADARSGRDARRAGPTAPGTWYLRRRARRPRPPPSRASSISPTPPRSRCSRATARTPSSSTARSTTSASCGRRSSAPATASAPTPTRRCSLGALPARGAAMLAELRGMFAFALWDGRAAGMLLARDLLRRQAALLRPDAGTVRFASQVKALLAGGRVARRQDPAGVAGFFLRGYVPEPFTLYGAVRRPAGSYAWVDDAGWAGRARSLRSPRSSPRRSTGPRPIDDAELQSGSATPSSSRSATTSWRTSA